MHSYIEPVSLSVPIYNGEEAKVAGSRRPTRLVVVAASLAAFVALVLALASFTPSNNRTSLESLPKVVPKFVDWKKEDAGSDDMNLHLQVADALAKADGLAEKGLKPVPEDLLKEAQQAAEEQRSMPSLGLKKVRKDALPANLEKMFEQAEAEQKVEKITKEGDKAEERQEAAVEEKKKELKKQAAKKIAASKKSKAEAEKKASLKLLKQVVNDAKVVKKGPASKSASK
uniref:Transmembrane protein n=1 Tax=Hanusia phi TaxID=3032 RepID=A0A7S0F0G9_9CRYP